MQTPFTHDLAKMKRQLHNFVENTAHTRPHVVACCLLFAKAEIDANGGEGSDLSNDLERMVNDIEDSFIEQQQNYHARMN